MQATSISIGRFTFEGPYQDIGELQNKAGVYAIHCYRVGNSYPLVDVGESSDVKWRVESHDRKSCWSRNCAGTLMVSVFYTPGLSDATRRAIEQEIRDQYNPPCGER